MPMVMMAAVDLGVTGRERPQEFDANPALMERIERIRLQAGQRMGLGDVSGSVVPKPVIVSAADDPSCIVSRYFTPHRCHTSHAATGAIGVATAFALPGTVASGVARPPGRHRVAVLHPSGRLEVGLELQGEGAQARVERAALVRTARKIFAGELYLAPHMVQEPETQEAELAAH